MKRLSKKYGQGAGLSKIDFTKALQNLTDILIDVEKFNELNVNIFNALDEDDLGLVPKITLKKFTEDFLEGTQAPGQPSSSFTGNMIMSWLFFTILMSLSR